MAEVKNLLTKLNEARAEFRKAKLTKSGENKFAKYTYFELGDILPTITELENKYKFITLISFDSQVATAKVVNTENPEDYLFFLSPMEKADISGCQPIQNLGGCETYQRRYLYYMIYEIVESDLCNAVQGNPETSKAPSRAQNKPQVKASTPGGDSLPWEGQTPSEKMISGPQRDYLNSLGYEWNSEEEKNSLTYAEADSKIKELLKQKGGNK